LEEEFKFKLPNPQDSVYWHPTLNPLGAPPPGAPLILKSSLQPFPPSPQQLPTTAQPPLPSYSYPYSAPPPPGTITLPPKEKDDPNMSNDEENLDNSADEGDEEEDDDDDENDEDEEEEEDDNDDDNDGEMIDSNKKKSDIDKLPPLPKTPPSSSKISTESPPISLKSSTQTNTALNTKNLPSLPPSLLGPSPFQYTTNNPNLPPNVIYRQQPPVTNYPPMPPQPYGQPQMYSPYPMPIPQYSNSPQRISHSPSPTSGLVPLPHHYMGYDMYNINQHYYPPPPSAQQAKPPIFQHYQPIADPQAENMKLQSQPIMGPSFSSGISSNINSNINSSTLTTSATVTSFVPTTLRINRTQQPQPPPLKPIKSQTSTHDQKSVQPGKKKDEAYEAFEKEMAALGALNKS